MKKQLITSLNYLAFLLFLLTFAVNTSAQNVGDQAPDFTLTSLNNANFTLSNQQGKVVFIFLFGYACPHCLANGNNTQIGIYNTYKNNSEFIAIGIDTWDGNKSGVESFINSTGIQYTVLLKGSSVESLYQTTYDRIIVVDKQGVIRYKSNQNSTYDVVNEAANTIQTYLDAGSTGINDLAMNENESLNIFPVPAINRLTINSDLPWVHSAVISILSTTGSILYRNTAKSLVSDGKSYSIPLYKLPAGIYVLRIKNGSNLISRKFTIVDK